METLPQFIKNNQGEDILAVISINTYNDLKYDKANLREENIPDWHKEILAEDLHSLEKNLKEKEPHGVDWEQLKREIQKKYGY